MKSLLDVLFIQPIVHRKQKLLHVIMPVGVFGLATILAKSGIKTRIIHQGIEELLNPSFSIETCIETYNPKIVCLSLHWYVHTYEVIKIAQIAKKVSGALIVLGGFTATFYDLDILKNFPFIDVVIRGDGEIPLFNLVKSYLENKPFKDIPNITFRSNGKIRQNKVEYINRNLKDTPSPNFNYLQNWEKYFTINLSGKPEVPLYAIFDEEMPKAFDLVYFRGCPFQCSYCSGGKEIQSRIFFRDSFEFRNLIALIKDCQTLKKQGIEEIRIEYIPYKGLKEYYLKFFKILKKQGLSFSARVSLWNIPPKNILEAICNTFNHITFVLSPDSASEKVRRKNKGIFYSNEKLLNFLEFAKNKQYKTQLWFMTGLPGETLKDYQQSLKFAKMLLLEKMISDATCVALNIEPASPLYFNPEKYKLKLFRQCFMDFYKWGKEVSSGQKLTHYLGFEKHNLSQSQILEMAKNFNREIQKVKFKNAIR